MSSYLGVSKELIRSRLIDFGWLIDVRRVLPVRDSAARVIDNLESWAADEPEENAPKWTINMTEINSKSRPPLAARLYAPRTL